MHESRIHNGDRDATYPVARSRAMPACRGAPPRSLEQWLSQYLAGQYRQSLAEPLPVELRQLLAKLGRDR